MNRPHPHAASMLLYAQDAAETDKPWERWLCMCKKDAIWRDGFEEHPIWHEDFEYRRKPKTITVNGIEVPEPIREEPKVGELYFVVNLSAFTLVTSNTWANDVYDIEWFKRGLLHFTEEAAIAHTEALLAPSQRN